MPRLMPLEKLEILELLLTLMLENHCKRAHFILYWQKHKIGEVHEGAAKMDWMEQERERGITITGGDNLFLDRASI